MHLTRYTDFSLRVLLYLGLRPETRVSIDEITDFYDISRDHLIKVVNHLSKLGYIHTIRGRNGGIELAVDMGQIKVGEVVRKMEPNFHIVECFNPETNHCMVTPVCNLKHILSEANDAFLHVLDQYTLKEMVDNHDRAQQLISIEQ